MRGSKAHQEQVYASLLKKHGPLIAKAFREAVRNGAREVSLDALSRAIELGDIERVKTLLRLEPERMFALSEAIRSNFMEAGSSVNLLAPSAAEFAFSGTHAAAERWIVDNGGRLIQGISDEAIEVVRDVIREGVKNGYGSAKTARELVGKGKAREGARVGLTREQSRAVDNTRRNLQELDSAYFKRAWRDKRYDPMVRKAIKDGKPLTKTQIDKITARYAERAEQYRARLIAQQETRRGIAGGQDQAYRQLAERPNVDSVTKRWQWNPGSQKDPREFHQEMSGTVRQNYEPFVFPDGAQLMYPNDPAGPASHTLWCRCTVVRRVHMRVE